MEEVDLTDHLPLPDKQPPLRPQFDSSQLSVYSTDEDTTNSRLQPKRLKICLGAEAFPDFNQVTTSLPVLEREKPRVTSPIFDLTPPHVSLSKVPENKKDLPTSLGARPKHPERTTFLETPKGLDPGPILNPKKKKQTMDKFLAKQDI